MFLPTDHFGSLEASGEIVSLAGPVHRDRRLFVCGRGGRALFSLIVGTRHSLFVFFDRVETWTDPVWNLDIAQGGGTDTLAARSPSSHPAAHAFLSLTDLKTAVAEVRRVLTTEHWAEIRLGRVEESWRPVDAVSVVIVRLLVMARALYPDGARVVGQWIADDGESTTRFARVGFLVPS